MEQRLVYNPWQTCVYQQDDKLSEIETSTPQLQLRKSTRIQKSNPKYRNTTIVKEVFANEPKTFQESSQTSWWIKAIEEEVTTFEENQTWDLVPNPSDVKPISCKWIYKIKCHPNGLIER